MSGAPFITVLFTCHKCGVQRVRALVRARRRDEDVRDWMLVAGQACGNRHGQVSPQCPQRELDLAIPAPLNEGDGIGMTAAAVPDDVKLPEMNSRAAN